MRLVPSNRGSSPAQLELASMSGVEEPKGVEGRLGSGDGDRSSGDAVELSEVSRSMGDVDEADDAPSVISILCLDRVLSALLSASAASTASDGICSGGAGGMRAAGTASSA